MANPLVLAHNAIDQQRPQLVRGQVSTAKPAPANFAAPLYVVIPQWQADIYFVLTDWPQLHGSTLPAQGIPCLLAFDDQRQLWCVSW